MDSKAHYQHSSLRERIVEHVFVGEALRELWRLDVTNVEVMRSEFDAYGYDIVMSRGPIVRHIQFKTGKKPRPVRVSISRNLYEKPSGCVIWIRIDDDLNLKSFYWLGATPGKPLVADLAVRAAKGRRNKDGKRLDRPNHVYLSGSKFEPVPALRHLLVKLFGPLEGKTA